MEEIKQWYSKNNCSHAHCPDGCEHPQPFVMEGRLVCGRCAVMFNDIVDMIPCNPTLCGDDV